LPIIYYRTSYFTATEQMRAWHLTGHHCHLPLAAVDDVNREADSWRVSDSLKLILSCCWLSYAWNWSGWEMPQPQIRLKNIAFKTTC